MDPHEAEQIKAFEDAVNYRMEHGPSFNWYAAHDENGEMEYHYVYGREIDDDGIER